MTAGVRIVETEGKTSMLWIGSVSRVLRFGLPQRAQWMTVEPLSQVASKPLPAPVIMIVPARPWLYGAYLEPRY